MHTYTYIDVFNILYIYIHIYIYIYSYLFDKLRVHEAHRPQCFVV